MCLGFDGLGCPRMWYSQDKQLCGLFRIHHSEVFEAKHLLLFQGGE